MGFWALETLGKRYDISYPKNTCKAVCANCFINNEKVILAMPQTYMNSSGESIRALTDYYKIDVETKLIVIYDDISLPPGTIRVREKGSAGGHNGIKNIIHLLGTQDFMRVRIGIGEKPPGWNLADYVLGHIPETEKNTMKEAVEKAADAVEMILKDGIEKTMSYYNSKVK